MHEITEVAWSNAPADRAGTLLVVALHGRGADETSMVGIDSYLPSGVTVAAPRGPIALDVGFTWFENRGIGRPIAESIQATADGLFAWLDTVAVAHTGVVVLGFSGGTAMGGGLLFAHPDRFAGAVLIAGTLPWDAGFDSTPGRFTDLPVLWTIDPADAVIPRDLVERSEAWLRDESGATLLEVPARGVGHGISGSQLEAIHQFISDLKA